MFHLEIHPIHSNSSFFYVFFGENVGHVPRFEGLPSRGARGARGALVARVARVAAARVLQWQRVVVQRVDVQRGSASEGGGRSWGVDWDFSCL